MCLNKSMQVTIFGANGKVGRLVVEKALKKGLRVVAFSHSETILKADPNLQIVQGDIYNSQDVNKAIMGSEIVISALGSWGTPNKDVLTEGMKNIIPSMNQQKISRIISLTGSDAYVEGEKYNLLHRLTHLLIGLLAKKILQDGERHLKLLKDSGLDWTVVRSPVMNNRGKPKNYVLTNNKIMPWSTINRVSVAECLIEQMTDRSYTQKAPYIKRNLI